MFFKTHTLQEGLTPLLTPDIVSERGRIRGEGPPLNEGRGYAKDMRGVDIGYISYEQLNTYEHDKMSGHKKIPTCYDGDNVIVV